MSEHDEQREIPGYEITDVLRSGVARRTYRAIRKTDRQTVAITTLGTLESREGEALDYLSSTSETLVRAPIPTPLARILDWGAQDDLLFQVTEDLEGEMLQDLVARRDFSVAEALSLFKTICEGLSIAHQLGIVHGSLDPTCIFVTEDLARIKIQSYGFPGQLAAPSADEGTLPTAQLFTMHMQYLAPEVATAGSPATPQSDIYAAGAIAYEVLTGQVPVGRFSLPSQLNPEVPSDLDPIVLRCLSNEPERRFGSAVELRREIRKLELKLGLDLANELRGIRRQASDLTRSNTSKVVAGVALGVLIAVGAFVAARFFESDPATPQPPSDPAPAAATVAVPGTGQTTPPDDSSELSSTATEAAARADTPPATARADAADLAPTLAAARDKIDAAVYLPAIDDLEELVAQHPGHPALAEAYLLIAKAHLGAGAEAEARAALIDVRSRYPRASQAAEAGYRLGELDSVPTDASRVERAREAFAEVAASHPESTWALQALNTKSVLEERAKLVEDDELGRPLPVAISTLRLLVANYPDTTTAETARWRLGNLLEDAKLPEEAAETFVEIGENNANTRFEAWWKAGELYRDLDDIEAALDAYGKVPETSEYYDRAQRRIRRLSR
jgi:serine/threonine protein kinase